MNVPKDTVIQVRKALASDAGAIAGVQTETWRHSFRGYVADALLDSMVVSERRIRSWQEILNDPNPNRCVFVATGVERVLGFVSGGTDMDGQRSYDSEIKAIYVAPNAQRNGAGKLLTGAFVDFVISRNAKSMIIWTIADGPSGSFYLGLGGEPLPLRDTLNYGAEKIPVAAYAWRDLLKLRALLGNGKCKS